MAFSLLVPGFLVISFVLIVVFVFINFTRVVPAFLRDLYLFGKLRSGPSGIWCASLPKRWFTHFYGIGTVWTSVLLVLSMLSWQHTQPLHDGLQDLFRCLQCDRNTAGPVDGTSTMITLLMVELQVVRRLYECLFVSVYSKAVISIVHYVMGILFYLLVPVSIMCAGPTVMHVDIMQDINAYHVLGLLLFAFASRKQYNSHVILAKLRKPKSGKVENYGHHIPNGDLFQFVSCPNFFTEILIYLSMNVVLGFKNPDMNSLWVFVLINQTILGYLGHQWYLQTFKERYPKERRAIIPFVL